MKLIVDGVEGMVGAIDSGDEDMTSPFDSDRFEPGLIDAHLLTIFPVTQTVTAPRVLLSRFIDYAGMYPPESLSLEDALSSYVRHRRNVYEWMLGPFLCPSSQLHDLEWLLGGDPIPVGVVFDRPVDESVASVEASGLDIRQIETRDTKIGEYLSYLPSAAAVWVEAPPIEVHDVASSYPNRRIGVKVRCGGETPAHFPSPAHLAHVMHATFVRGLPLKATAGLHHPWRHFAVDLGVWRHGFLNLAAAAAALVLTSDEGEAEHILSTDIPGLLTRRELRIANRSYSAAELKSGRVFFRSYGSCSFDEPVDDLGAMGSLWGAR